MVRRSESRAKNESRNEVYAVKALIKVRTVSRLSRRTPTF